MQVRVAQWLTPYDKLGAIDMNEAGWKSISELLKGSVDECAAALTLRKDYLEVPVVQDLVRPAHAFLQDY